MKRILGLVLVLVVVLAGVLAIRHKKAGLARLSPPEVPAIPVDVAPVRRGTIAASLKTVALIQSGTAATVSAQVAGALLEVRFREGDPVRKGEVMARVDSRVLEDAIASAEARVAAARQERARQEAIVARDSVLVANDALSKQAFEASQAQVEAAKAAQVAAERALASARTLRSFADVPAPWSGVVSARLAEPGDLVAPGRPVFTVQVAGPVRVLSKLSQESLALLAPGGRVVFSNGSETREARISRIYPALDASRLGTVETDLPSAPFSLPPGSTVAATYAAASSPEGLVVPSSALLEGTAGTLVVRAKDGKAELVRVAVAAGDGRSSAVAGDLAAGDLVVIGLPSELMALTAGTPVVPRER